MSDMSLFFKSNQKQKDNVFYTATKSLCDENGEPLKWEIRPISTRENDRLQDECTSEVQVPGKANRFRQRLNTSKYLGKLLTESVVYPDLLSAELQDSYKVNTPEDLLKEMISNPGEYSDFALFVQDYNGFDTSTTDLKDKAKN